MTSALIFVLSLAAHADDIKIKAKNLSKPVKFNDTLIVTETCNAKDLPIQEPGVKIERLPSKAVTGIGASTSLFSITKGNVKIVQMVIGETSLEDFKKGNYTGMGLTGKGGCERQTLFRLVSPDDQCTSNKTQVSESQSTQ